MYMRLDSDIALFAKTLKNECDQEFRGVQEYVKEQVFSALKGVIKEKYSSKSEGEITDLLDLFKNNQLKLDKWMWSKTLGRLYN